MSGMTWIDWVILIVPVTIVMWVAWRSRRYIRDVSDFLAAGRVCGRYAISVADTANAISIISLAAFVEVHYKTGFALTFWGYFLMPLGIIVALTGYCVYRFRETKAMSLGQFLEMRYNRSLRIFAATLRSLSEMLANMICPAIAARFFIYFFDFPTTIYIFGFPVQTFMIVVTVCLILAISIICMGGTLALVITDTLQGLFCFPLLVVFTIFVLVQFSWSQEIIPVMGDRIAGESFLNPYDIKGLRDFNIFMLVVTAINAVFHRASWIGAGNTSAARSPHEQKMAGVLGTWRSSFSATFYLLIAVTLLTLLNHRDFAQQGHEVKVDIAQKISSELIADEEVRAEIDARVAAVPVHNHIIGVDAPLSHEQNLDTPYLDEVLQVLRDNDPEVGTPTANSMFQEFRTLYHQVMMAVGMRHLLPPILMGLFCLLMVLMMISTDDSRIYSASLTISQDVILPVLPKALTPKQHINLLRWVSIGVGVFFFVGSSFMAQLDYIQLFATIMTSLWLGGCGPVMIFGLYGRFGTTAGAFSSLITGMGVALSGILLQRNWADIVYPWLAKMNWVDSLDHFLITVSSPFGQYIEWKMDPIKFPINSYEIMFIAMMLSIVAYFVGSALTYRGPFNLERMLHRGIYCTDHDKIVQKFQWSKIFSQLVGITPEYTRGDKIIAWSVLLYSVGYTFFGTFVAVAIWNAISPWPAEWWGYYFLIVFLLVPGAVAAVSAVWFTIGGVIDLRQLFIDLKKRVSNPLDNGRVEGHVSLADQSEFKNVEEAQQKKQQ